MYTYHTYMQLILLLILFAENFMLTFQLRTYRIRNDPRVCAFKKSHISN